MSGGIQLSNIRYLNDYPRNDINVISSPDVTSFGGVPSSKSEREYGQTNQGFDGYPEIHSDNGYEEIHGSAGRGVSEARGPDIVDRDDEESNSCLRKIDKSQEAMEVFFNNHGKKLKYAVGIILLLAYGAYFAYAMYRGLDSEDQIRLLWITVLVIVLCIISVLRKTIGTSANEKVISPITKFIRAHFSIFKWGFILIFVALVIVFLVLEVAIPRPENLKSLIGFAVYIFLLFIFSENPSKVKWRSVCWGLGIQFVFALLILKTTWGFEAFKWMGERVSEFLLHTDTGSIFVFGDSFEDHFFAFKVLPVVIFFSTTISILYYLGVMQIVILKIAWVMQVTMGTTAAESVNAAGNIFIGQTEAPLLIRPFIDQMTPSELHAVMTGGFATIAGSVMATYIMFGVQANHLITASVMAAPCALAMSKLSCPETKPSSERAELVMEKPPQRNMIEAASAGASAAISLVANIAANLIAFMALLAFVNATLQWIGSRVGMVPPDYPELTFQLICSYVLWPFAFVMGIDASDCRKVAELIGFKTFINEFVAYTELGKLIENRAVLEAYGDRPWNWVNGNIVLEETGVILIGGVISIRSEVISTYALCGFANVSSIGMVMGALGAMSVKQKPVIAQLALRAMVTGNIVCFLNACTAGLLYNNTG